MEFTTALMAWYDRHKRTLPWRGTGDAYAVLVSEIMLQQTRAAAVIPYYGRFMNELPTVEALAACDEERLLKLWEGLGYYSRARNLKKCALAVVNEHGGRFPDSAEELKKLPGVGPYTAGAIASIAFGEQEPAVDGNVLRVLARLFEDGADVTRQPVRDRWTDFLRDRMGSRPGDLNQAFMDLGSLICLPKSPLCHSCPLSSLCGAAKHGTWDRYPNRGEKKSKRRRTGPAVRALRAAQPTGAPFPGGHRPSPHRAGGPARGGLGDRGAGAHLHPCDLAYAGGAADGPAGPGAGVSVVHGGRAPARSVYEVFAMKMRRMKGWT